MIIEWVLGLSAGFNEWLFSLFPTVDEVPAYVSDPFAGWETSIGPYIDGIGYWINLPALLVIVAASVVLWGIFAVIRLARAAAGHVPLVGGNG